MKKPFFAWTILVLLGIVILLSFLGIIVELLFQFNVLKTDIVNIRAIEPVSLILSIAFIISGTFFGVYFFKLNKKALNCWHIFMSLWLIGVLYKLVKPTFLTSIVPFFFIISIALLFLIWFGIFIYLKKIIRK